MTIALLTDLHWGARGDTQHTIEYYEKFYGDTFFPALQKHNIREVCILGDTFDRRKYTNHNTLFQAKRILFDPLAYMRIKVHILVGNHDAHFKNTNEVNTVKLVLGEYSNVKIYDNVSEPDIDGIPVFLVPWICEANHDDVMKYLSTTRARVCMGHLELSGFKMYRGMEAMEGTDPKIFSKFDMVYTGHYHTQSRKDNIWYIGNPYELTWNDYNDPRGFHIVDLMNPTVSKFIENPNRLFERYEYDDSKSDPLAVDMSVFTDKYVKIVVTNKSDHYVFDRFIRNLYHANPADVKVIEDFSEFTEGEVDDTINLEDTESVLMNYIESIETVVDKDRVKNYMKTLYVEALSMGEME